MDGLQTQLMLLHQKVDKLSQMVEQMSSKITANFEDHQISPLLQPDVLVDNPSLEKYPLDNQEYFTLDTDHKDVLIDGQDWESAGNGNNGQPLSPETQIRRLTAQLTAAYNRIAALEEQLLSRRIHF